MTHEDFVKWLDKEIEDNTFREQRADTKIVASYYQGCTSTLCTVKEKFFTLTPPPTTLS